MVTKLTNTDGACCAAGPPGRSASLMIIIFYFPDSLSADPVMKQAVSAESKAVLPYLGLNSFVIFLFAGIITLSSSSFRLF